MNLEYINRTTSAKNCCKSIDLSLTSSERQRDTDCEHYTDREHQGIEKGYSPRVARDNSLGGVIKIEVDKSTKKMGIE